jgi:exosortase/archaeosortase family protein
VKSSKPKQKPTASDKQFLKVGFLFCAIVIVCHILIWYFNADLAIWDIFTSYVTTALVRVSGLYAVRHRFTIYLSHSTWEVATECTALFIMVIFSAFIFVYPSSVKEKGIALVAGIPFIFGANIIRLYIMAWIDYLKPQYTSFFHDYVWQVFFIVMVIFMWMVWIDKVVNCETKTSIPA